MNEDPTLSPRGNHLTLIRSAALSRVFARCARDSRRGNTLAELEINDCPMKVQIFVDKNASSRQPKIFEKLLTCVCASGDVFIDCITYACVPRGRVFFGCVHILLRSV